MNRCSDCIYLKPCKSNKSLYDHSVDKGLYECNIKRTIDERKHVKASDNILRHFVLPENKACKDDFKKKMEGK